MCGVGEALVVVLVVALGVVLSITHCGVTINHHETPSSSSSMEGAAPLVTPCCFAADPLQRAAREAELSLDHASCICVGLSCLLVSLAASQASCKKLYRRVCLS